MAALQRRIRVAMDQPVEYNTITCNCVHFALALLGLGHLAGAMVGATIRSGATALGHLGTCSSQVSPNSFFPGVPSTAVMEVAVLLGSMWGWSILPWGQELHQ